jgi:hypothetical protein
MPDWRAILSGDPFDLESIADLGVGVTKEDGAFVLRSEQFRALTEAEQVRERALLLVEAINGAAKVLLGQVHTVAVGSIEGDDGSGGFLVLIGETVRLGIRERVQVIDGATGLPIVSRPSGSLSAWLDVAEREPRVRKALRLFTGESSWGNL